MIPNDIPINKLKKGKVFTFDIQEMAFGGKGIAKIPGEDGTYPVFIPGTLPGQVVTAKIIKRKKSFSEAKLREIKKHSDLEVRSSYFPIPGAPYINWPIEEQQKHKRSSAIEILKRIGKIENAETLLDEFIPSPASYHYRNKMEYSFSTVIFDPETGNNRDDFGLGFKHRGQWLSVENLDGDSGLFDAEIEDRLEEFREYFISTELPAYHPARHEGFFRFINFRKSFYEDKFLLNLTTSSEGIERFDRQKFIDFTLEIHGDRVAGILHTLNDGLGDRAFNEPENTQLIYGRDTVTEKISGLEFEMSIRSFFQPNPAAAEKLYRKAAEYALSGSDREKDNVLMDLFCGTGTIGQILAAQSPEGTKIIGVDIVKSAVENAKTNAAKNGLSNLEFYAADVKRFLIEYPVYENKISTVVMDPPRSGIAPKTLKRIIQLNTPKIVYISCNPATQARDMITLRETGYELKKWSVVDQFPHTAHIETVALFEKQSGKS